MGVPSRTLKGSDQLSYCAARIRNTNSSDRPKIADGGHALRRLLLLKGHAGIIESHLRAAWSARNVLKRLHGLAANCSRARPTR